MNKNKKDYTLSKEQRIVLTILKEIETSEYGKNLCKEILQKEYYSESEKGFLNILRELFYDELEKRFDSAFIKDVNGNKFKNNTFTNKKGYVMGVDTATGQSVTSVRVGQDHSYSLNTHGNDTYSNITLPITNLYVNGVEQAFVINPNIAQMP